MCPPSAGSGDPTRAGWTGEGDPSLFWRSLHGGRRSVVIDLSTEAGPAALTALAADADVVVENLRPGVTSRFGVDGPSLRRVYPHLVTCAITGFDDELLAGAAATDGPVQAWTGAIELMERWSGQSLPMPLAAADIAGGSYAAQGVLAALVARGRSGVGAHIEVSLSAALAQWIAVADRQMTLAPPNTLVLAGSDGERFLVQAPLRFAARLLEVLGLPQDTASDTVATAAAEIVAGAPSLDWLKRLWSAGIPAAPLRPLSEDVPNPPWRIDGRQLLPAGDPPALGAHNRQGWS